MTAQDDILSQDRPLLDAFRAGERDALARIFRHYVEDVTRTLRSGVKVKVDGQATRVGSGLPEGEIEALVQETFLKAFSPKARQSYDGLRPFGAWLATIARNLLVDRTRGQRRRAVLMEPGRLDELAGEEPEPASSALWRLEEQDLARLVAEARADIGEPGTSIYRLRYEQGLSLRETAEGLGMALITVRRHDARLRQALLSRLRENGYLRNAKVHVPA